MATVNASSVVPVERFAVTTRRMSVQKGYATASEPIDSPL